MGKILSNPLILIVLEKMTMIQYPVFGTLHVWLICFLYCNCYYYFLFSVSYTSLTVLCLLDNEHWTSDYFFNLFLFYTSSLMHKYNCLSVHAWEISTPHLSFLPSFSIVMLYAQRIDISWRALIVILILLFQPSKLWDDITVLYCYVCTVLCTWKDLEKNSHNYSKFDWCETEKWVSSCLWSLVPSQISDLQLVRNILFVS